jgi:hypothetical protein
MNARLSLIFAHMSVALAVCTSGCSKRDNDNAGSNAAPAVGQAQTLAPGALDRCIVGTWKSTEATLNLKLAQASGGANVEMKIEPSGACSMDFTPMSAINATAKPVNFDFHYSGKASALLKTPTAGVITAVQPNYSGLKASAMIHMPGGATMPLLTNVPVASMAPTSGPKASPTGTAQGIDSSPVVSADSYTCSASTLTLSSSIAHTQWSFSRVGK